MDVKFGETASDYARHRAGFPDSLFDRLRTHGIGVPGQQVVDVGTGTGALARGFAKRGCQVVGIDPAPELIAQAAILDTEAHVTVDYRVASAEATGLADAAYDVLTAGQCWHWFEGAGAAAEARRVLVPGGHLAIVHFDWIPLQGNVPAVTEALIREHNPAWQLDGGTGLYPAWLAHVGVAGFGDIETFSFDVAATYSHEDWRGRIRASAGVGASLSKEAVARFDAALAERLASDHPADPMQVPHRVFGVVCRNPT